jgi:diketogulonate reductase-like aldo/keto reductase
MEHHIIKGEKVPSLGLGTWRLTSTVQRRIHDFVVVRCCSDIPANKPILSKRFS